MAAETRCQGCKSRVEVLLDPFIVRMGAALFDIVVDVIHVQVVCDQTVQAVGLIDAILDRIFSELHVADADESDGHHVTRKPMNSGTSILTRVELLFSAIQSLHPKNKNTDALMTFPALLQQGGKCRDCPMRLIYAS